MSVIIRPPVSSGGNVTSEEFINNNTPTELVTKETGTNAGGEKYKCCRVGDKIYAIGCYTYYNSVDIYDMDLNFILKSTDTNLREKVMMVLHSHYSYKNPNTRYSFGTSNNAGIFELKMNDEINYIITTKIANISLGIYKPDYDFYTSRPIFINDDSIYFINSTGLSEYYYASYQLNRLDKSTGTITRVATTGETYGHEWSFVVLNDTVYIIGNDVNDSSSNNFIWRILNDDNTFTTIMTSGIGNTITDGKETFMSGIHNHTMLSKIMTICTFIGLKTYYPTSASYNTDGIYIDDRDVYMDDEYIILMAEYRNGSKFDHNETTIFKRK